MTGRLGGGCGEGDGGGAAGGGGNGAGAAVQRLRESDLLRLRALLREALSSEAAPVVALSGARATGKSTLLERALLQEGIPCFTFTARRDESSQRALQRLLEELSAAAARDGSSEWETAMRRHEPPRSWREALTLALSATASRAWAHPGGERAGGGHPGGGRAGGGRAGCLVIDELPLLAAQEQGIEASIAAALRAARGGAGAPRAGGLGDRPPAVVLVGADLHLMEALGQRGRPLQGLLQSALVEPLSPLQLSEATGLPALAALDAHCVLGGLPQLVSRWRPGDTLLTHLQRELSCSTSPLIVTGERIACVELPPKSAALAALHALGEGHVEFNAIVNRTRLGRTALSGALKRHVLRGTLVRDTPFATGEDAKLTRYGVADPYLRFWLRFVGPHLPALARGRHDLVLAEIRRGWAAFSREAIQPIVRESLRRILPSGSLGAASEVGLHWDRPRGATPGSGLRSELLLVGATRPLRQGSVAFLASICWRDGACFDSDRARALAQMRRLVPLAGEDALLVGISRDGFQGGLGLDVEIGPQQLIEAWKRHKL